jgi:electron transfer flavoprotein alpha subunit
MNAPQDARSWVGVIVPEADGHGRELLGDAADLADRLGSRVSACTARAEAGHHQDLIAHGADQVSVLVTGDLGPNHRLAGAADWHKTLRPRIVLAGATGDDRALAARLAVRSGARLVSPALSVAVRGQGVIITGLTADGRRARQFTLDDHESAVVTLRPGVGQARTPRADRSGEVLHLQVQPQHEPAQVTRRLPADPATTDIVHLPRLVAGGRGLGGKEGFEFLRQVAARLDAGVAASRMAVDQGWIERERQVGQTGKTVRPELYLACGISGASHHREGMADSRHIIAINVDPAAPIFQIAHLGLVSDWRETLRHFLDLTDPHASDAS